MGTCAKAEAGQQDAIAGASTRSSDSRRAGATRTREEHKKRPEAGNIIAKVTKFETGWCCCKISEVLAEERLGSFYAKREPSQKQFG